MRERERGTHALLLLTAITSSTPTTTTTTTTTTFSGMDFTGGMLVEILKDGDCTHLFFFGILVAVVASVELLYGSWTGSLGKNPPVLLTLTYLGLISTAFHTTMDCITIFISLFAMVLAKHRPTSKYSYGYCLVVVHWLTSQLRSLRGSLKLFKWSVSLICLLVFGLRGNRKDVGAY